MKSSNKSHPLCSVRWAACGLTTLYFHDFLPNRFWELQVWKQIKKSYMWGKTCCLCLKSIPRSTAGQASPRCYCVVMDFGCSFFAGSSAANVRSSCKRSAEGKNNCVPQPNARGKAGVGASFGSTHRAVLTVLWQVGKAQGTFTMPQPKIGP